MKLLNPAISIRTIFVIALLTAFPATSYATQAHGAPEGLFSHQLAHFFFVISMGSLIFWLKKSRLSNETGWRYILYAAICLILWNMSAFAAHYMDEQFLLVNVTRLNNWRIQIVASNSHPTLAVIYYLCKLDHLLCVPALIFLYAGLRRLKKDLPTETNQGTST